MTETVSEWKERFLKEQEEKITAKEMEEFERKHKANALKEVCRTESFTIPDGEYYVGCPYLVLPKEKCEWWFEQEAQCFEFDGHKVISIDTGGDGYWHLFDRNEDGTEVDEDGNPIEGPVHVDSLFTDGASMSIIPMELLESLGCDSEVVKESGYVFWIETCKEEDEEVDLTFDVEFKYKVYDGDECETLSHVEFLWYKLNVACQYMEDN